MGRSGRAVGEEVRGRSELASWGSPPGRSRRAVGEVVTGRSELADGGGSPPGDRDWRKGDEGFHGGDQVGHGSASPRGGRGRPGGGGPRTGPASPSARASLHSKLISNRKGLWKGLGFSRTATFSTDTLAIASPRLAAPQQGQGQGQGQGLPVVSGVQARGFGFRLSLRPPGGSFIQYHPKMATPPHARVLGLPQQNTTDQGLHKGRVFLRGPGDWSRR